MITQKHLEIKTFANIDKQIIGGLKMYTKLPQNMATPWKLFMLWGTVFTVVKKHLIEV